MHGLGMVVAAKSSATSATSTASPPRPLRQLHRHRTPGRLQRQPQRHRLNTGGNRQLNAALHTIAVCQARDPGPGRGYYLRKISEGKTPPRPAERSNDASPTSSTGTS